MSTEFSELQAVDFGLGAYIAAAFTGLASVGPAAYREFLGRATNKKIYRHDTESPTEFLSAFRSANKAEETVAGVTSNPAALPIVVYFRKPGLTNGTNRELLRRGRNSYAEGLQGALINAYKFMHLPLVLDYRLYILSWDKPALDKLQLAWYAYQTRNEKFTCRYAIGENGDTFDVPAHVVDNKALLFSDESIPSSQGVGRLYAVSSGLQVETDVIFGESVSVPDPVEIQGVLAHYLEFRTGVAVNG